MNALQPLQPLHHWPLHAVLAVQAQAYGPMLCESAEVLARKIAAAAPTHPLSWGVGQGQSLHAYAIALPWHSGHAPQWNHASPGIAPPEADCLYLHDIAVAPTHHGQGLAAALLQHVLHQARTAPQPLHTAVLVAVQGAQHYWARHGFTAQTPPQPLHSFGPDAVWMRRRL